MLNGSMLKKETEEFAVKMSRNSFSATDGWLSWWKIRHNVKFKTCHGKKNSNADKLKAEERRSNRLPKLPAQYQFEGDL